MEKRIFSFFSVLVFTLAFTCCIGCQTEVSAANAAETPANQFLYQYSSTYQGVELTKYLGEDAVVHIPAEIGGIPVTAIGTECFYSKKRLKELIMPDSLMFIGNQAFYKCLELEQITWSENLKSIGKSAFVNCKIKYINMPDSLIYLGDTVFKDCKSLEEVICSEGLTELNGTFQGCNNLSIIHLPKSSQFTKIGTGSFAGCPLGKIEIPASVTEIGEHVFGSGFKKVTFPKDSRLKKIGHFAFAYCDFKTITLPASIEEIGTSLFDNCYSLKKISFEKNAKITKIPAGAFADCRFLEEIDIPENVTEIGIALFMDTDHGVYNKIKKINIKGGKIKKIAKGAFNGFIKGGTITVPKQYKKKYAKMFKKQKWYKKTMKIKAVKKI